MEKPFDFSGSGENTIPVYQYEQFKKDTNHSLKMLTDRFIELQKEYLVLKTELEELKKPAKKLTKPIKPKTEDK